MFWHTPVTFLVNRACSIRFNGRVPPWGHRHDVAGTVEGRMRRVSEYQEDGGCLAICRGVDKGLLHTCTEYGVCDAYAFLAKNSHDVGVALTGAGK